MQRTRRSIFSVILSGAIGLAAACTTEPASSPPEGAAVVDHAALVAHGKYIVTAGGCHDCHTPFKEGPHGPEPDMSRALSGHPAELVMPPPPTLPPGPWMIVASGTSTAWSGL